MRLTSEQIQDLHSVIKNFFGDAPYKLYLYGSRVHDHLKGGDIDLIIVTSEAGVHLFREQELSLLVQIKKQGSIGQRRIDLKVATESALKTDAFLKAISESMVEILCEFH